MNHSAFFKLFSKVDPETAHGIAMQLLTAASAIGLPRLLFPAPSKPVSAWGINFPNPVGLAAGYDKNALHVGPLGGLGFGFLELGTVTPRPQPGRERPRIFRIPEKSALINRMGFPNCGTDRFLENLARTRGNYRGAIGINIGKNADTPIERAEDDYVICLAKVYKDADFVVINVSSPNTQNLRTLQAADALRSLLTKLGAKRDELSRISGRKVPLVLKVAPDLDDEQIESVSGVALEGNCDGIVATNTTLNRTGVEEFAASKEMGGLSGTPLHSLSVSVFSKFAKHIGGRMPMVAAGGILCADDAKRFFDAGATLVELYTGFVYRGPGLIGEICKSDTRAS